MTLTTQSQIHNQSVATDFFNVLNSVKKSRSYDFFFFFKNRTTLVALFLFDSVQRTGSSGVIRSGI